MCTGLMDVGMAYIGILLVLYDCDSTVRVMMYESVCCGRVRNCESSLNICRDFFKRCWKEKAEQPDLSPKTGEQTISVVVWTKQFIAYY